MSSTPSAPAYPAHGTFVDVERPVRPVPAISTTTSTPHQLLRSGVQAKITKSGISQEGIVSLDEEYIHVIAGYGRIAQNWDTPRSSIRNIKQIPREHGEVGCMIMLDGGKWAFSFVCKSQGGYSSSDFATAMGRWLRGRGDVLVPDFADVRFPDEVRFPDVDVPEFRLGAMEHHNQGLIGHSTRQVEEAKAVPNNFTELLQPIGLLQYKHAFETSGLALEDLPYVNREDLAELVGITDRLHQIKVVARIGNAFKDKK